MLNDLRQLKTLTVASLKMYYRNRSAVFFSLFIPLLIILIFGVVLNNGASKYNLGVTDLAQNTTSKNLIETIDKTKAFSITKAPEQTVMKKLQQGDIDAYIVIPHDFTISNTQTAKITGFFDKSKAQNAQVGFLIIDNILAGYNQAIFSQSTQKTIPDYIALNTKGIATNNLAAIDYLIPGMIAFSVMQLGLFSVAFAFTTMKKTGALKRLQATPAKPVNFILGQSISRLILSVIQVLLLLYIGIALFKLHMYGNIFSFMLFVLLGSVVFLAMGFAVAGYSKDENQAAPIANLISFPMLFLSGVFFPRALMPEFLQNITSYLPLTYLSDALRQIANNGVAITALRTDLLGLIIWCIVAMIIAVRLFKWE